MFSILLLSILIILYHFPDPKLNVYHDCNDENVPCLKKFSVVIPDSYVSEGENPSKTFDVGVLNLAGTFSGESRDCLN